MSEQAPERSWEDQMIDPDGTMNSWRKQRVLTVLHAWEGPDWYRTAASSLWPAIRVVDALDEQEAALRRLTDAVIDGWVDPEAGPDD